MITPLKAHLMPEKNPVNRVVSGNLDILLMQEKKLNNPKPLLGFVVSVEMAGYKSMDTVLCSAIIQAT